MIGDSQSEIYNRRQQVQRFQLDEDENILQNIELARNYDQPLLRDQQQQQDIQAQTCFSRFFVQQPKFKSDEQQHVKDKAHKKYDDAWFEKFYKTPDFDTDIVIDEITLNDTIEGLELQYGVPAQRIRNYNHLNTNDIYYLKSIKIPNPQSDFKSQQNFDWPTFLKELKISEFVNKICQPEDKSVKVANYYLQNANWDMLLAINEYDRNYAYEQKQKYKSSKISKNKANF